MAEAEPFRQEMRLIVRKARERTRMSQSDFGAALGRLLGRAVTGSQVSDWERGRFPPSGNVLLAAAELAGGSIDELRAGGSGTIGQRIEALEAEIADLVHTVSDLRETADKLQSAENRLAELELEVGRLQAAQVAAEDHPEVRRESGDVAR